VGEDLQVLADEVRRIRAVLDDLGRRLREFRENELARLGRAAVSASYVALILENSYTALETLFLRVSQFFENSLAGDRWHSDLLDKMTLHVTGIRERVIEEETARFLHELLRFRHFRRYYLELDFDWNKLDYLVGVHDRAMPLISRDLARFQGFLSRLTDAAAE